MESQPRLKVSLEAVKQLTHYRFKGQAPTSADDPSPPLGGSAEIAHHSCRIGRELPIISAKSSWPNSGMMSVPRLSSMPTRVPSLLSTISSRTRKEEPMKVMYRSNVVDQAVLSCSSIRTAV